MKTILNLRSLSVFAVAIVMAIAAVPAAAQDTSSSIRVEVTDQGGSALGGVSVRVTHMPTGRSRTSSTNSSGVSIASGLAIGGPYEVTIVGGGAYAADVQQNIYVELDKAETIQIVARPTIEEVVVTAQAATQDVAVGVGRSFSSAEIEATPSISRDFVSTLARDPKILVDNSVARGPALSMAGQNFRFNSVTIDGIPQNDNFGLSKNASATQRSPISIDAIEAINVNLAPYDVTYGNFIGGNVNIVTKSGTNEFQGSAFYYTTDQSYTGNKSGDVDLGLDSFSEDVYGFTVGGPIIKDKLFFFANYEKFETTRPANAQTIDNIAGVDQADVDRFISILEGEYGYMSHGDFAATDDDEDEKIMLKIDWDINDRHRAAATYQVADGDVIFDDFPTVAALNSNRYNISERLDSFSAQLFSDWTDNFSTVFQYGKKSVENRQVSVDTSAPEFIVFVGAGLQAGGDRFRQNNLLDTESQIFKLKGDYVAGDHILTAGWERESKDVRNLFAPGRRGVFFFFGLDDLESRSLGFMLHGGAPDGQSADKSFTLDVDSFYIQDEWKPTNDLTLTFGVRFDSMSNGDKIIENPDFITRNGYTNTENLDGKSVTLPRFGFNWDATDRLTIRGGAGLFAGGAPLIILSNSYVGDGISRNFLNYYDYSFPQPFIDSLDMVMAELPDPDAAQRHMQQYNTVNPDAQVDAIHPDYDILSTWKYSLGAEYIADLGFLGEDWVLGADIILSDVDKGYDIMETRRTVADTAPDGRPIYDFPSNGDYVIGNTNKGSGTVITLNAAKSWDTNSGSWDLSMGYTNTDMEEWRSYNRFVTFETLAMDPSSDLNNPGLSPSRYEVEHRYTGTLSWQKDIWGDNTTSVGLVYQGRSGRHFSYVFGSANGSFGGTLFADFGSEGDNPGSQLFYVPTGLGDSSVTGDPGFLADLDEFIGSSGCLAKHRGSIIGRNACKTDWISTLSLRFVQEISIGNSKLDLMLNIENLENLLNSDWGRVESYTAPSNVAPATVDIDSTGLTPVYVYTPNASYQGTADTIVPKPEIAALPSVYRIQLGLRFRF